MTYNRRHLLRHGARAAAACATAGMLSSCGLFESTASPGEPSDTSTPDTPQPGGDRNTLFIYGWATYVDNTEIFEAFTKETGIRVVGDAYDSNEVMLSKLEAAGGRAGYSIIYPSDYMIEQMRALNLLVPLNRKLLPNLANIAPSYLNRPYDPGNRFSLPVSLGSTGIAYNVNAVTSIIGEEPTDWSYLWQHRDKLRMTLLKDVREVMGMALHTLGFSYNSENDDEIDRAFERLKELLPAVANFSTDAWTDLLRAGDLTLAMAFSGDGIRIAREDPNIKYLLPASGTSIWTDTIAIPKGAPNIEASHRWINYILRPEIAVSISDANSFGTTNRKAKEQLAPDLRAIAALDPSEAYIQKSQSIRKLSQSTLNLYETYWTRLTTGLG
jgi:spermidine/putrescine transport system substrate-binding protein